MGGFVKMDFLLLKNTMGKCLLLKLAGNKVER